jgi:BolA family transcriptional regulator, general stress-responsive regulator
MDRIEAIRARLAPLAPLQVDLIDEGHKHVGHAGARDGRGHFALRLVSVAFAGKSLLERHRMVYEALGDLMITDIHALSLKALTPEESK